MFDFSFSSALFSWLGGNGSEENSSIEENSGSFSGEIGVILHGFVFLCFLSVWFVFMLGFSGLAIKGCVFFCITGSGVCLFLFLTVEDFLFGDNSKKKIINATLENKMINSHFMAGEKFMLPVMFWVSVIGVVSAFVIWLVARFWLGFSCGKKVGICSLKLSLKISRSPYT